MSSLAANIESRTLFTSARAVLYVKESERGVRLGSICIFSLKVGLLLNWFLRHQKREEQLYVAYTLSILSFGPFPRDFGKE